MRWTWWLAGIVACGPADPVDEDTDGVVADTDADVDADTDTDVDTDTDADTADTGEPALTSDAPDYRQRGPYTVDVGSGQVMGSCMVPYDTYVPDGAPPVGVVVLSHGFARNAGVMAGWADHWASWGLAVAVPDMCALGALSVDHDVAWRDLVAVAGAVGGGGPVLYAGHSAGGLASFLATSQDPSAAAHLGLDAVDSEGRAVAAAPSVAVPSYHLIAAPSACNDDANFGPVFGNLADTRVLRIPGADHCDFESPTDFLCTALCADGSAPDGVVHDAILPLSTAFLLWHAGEPVAEQWWTPGDQWYDLLVTYAGILEL